MRELLYIGMAASECFWGGFRLWPYPCCLTDMNAKCRSESDIAPT